MTDEELVASAQSGNMKAFDTLIGLHQERVFALAYRILGDAEDAADVQQETFVRAWQSIKSFRAYAAFSTWLHRIAVNRCLSRKRRKQIEFVEPLNDELLRHSVEPVGTACLERAETGAIVRKIVAALPAHYGALIVLREIEERSFDEIAEILGCSVQSARTRLSKARKLLRERLEPYVAEELI
jgi:RNA polymerase sigma-70 factor (ECF subfamily)